MLRFMNEKGPPDCVGDPLLIYSAAARLGRTQSARGKWQV